LPFSFLLLILRTDVAEACPEGKEKVKSKKAKVEERSDEIP
jgi:hypothetical protein